MQNTRRTPIKYGSQSRRIFNECKKDGIIYQSVEAGKQADEQTSIEVTVSKGIEQVKVPKVTGMKKQKAITKLKAAGFTYSVNHDYSTSVSEGKIIKQSIKAGKYVNKRKSKNSG